jgi:hypothetical protein
MQRPRLRSLNREGAVIFGVSSRLSIFSISRLRSALLKSIWHVDSLLLFPCDKMKAVAQTKPTSEKLRSEVEGLRSTAARLQEQASRLVEKCAELEDLIARGTSKPTNS